MRESDFGPSADLPIEIAKVGFRVRNELEREALVDLRQRLRAAGGDHGAIGEMVELRAHIAAHQLIILDHENGLAAAFCFARCCRLIARFRWHAAD